MSVILALDVGLKRVGLAVSDSLRTIATPYKTFVRAKGKAEQEILDIIVKMPVELIVVGLPLNEKGAKTEQCRDIERFCRRLERRTGVKFEFFDEHLSSEEAKERLKASGSKRSRDKGALDAVAAAIILEDYLRQNGK